MASYLIFTDATADLNGCLTMGLANVSIIPMQVEINGKEYTYGPGGTITASAFYAMQREGMFATTTQINPLVYQQMFEPALRCGLDVVYLCFSSGMSGTIQAAALSIRELQARYPERKIVCIDTLCASVGEGFLVREAARKQMEGASLDELVTWVMAHRLNVCHWFTVDQFDHLRHGGRVSTAAAAAGTILQIKPLLHVDENGKLAISEKPRGRKRAIAEQLAKMEAGWMPELGKLVIIGHGDCPDGADQLRQEITARFPAANIYTTDIGPIIGAHTGPGMLAVIYWGSTR